MRDNNTILLKARYSEFDEQTVASTVTTLLPGTGVTYTSDGSDGIVVGLGTNAIALEDRKIGNTVDDIIPAGERVTLAIPRAGDIFNLRTSVVVTAGTLLSLNASGVLAAPASGEIGEWVAMETITDATYDTENGTGLMALVAVQKL